MPVSRHDRHPEPGSGSGPPPAPAVSTLDAETSSAWRRLACSSARQPCSKAAPALLTV